MTKRTQSLLVSIAMVLIVTLLQKYSTPTPASGSAGTVPEQQGLSPKAANIPAGFVPVLDVVDGDTIDVELNGAKQRLRLIGINTPETVDPRKPVECFGKEASKHAKELMTGKAVRLEADPSQDETDKYGRLLRYVFLEDGTNYNLAAIRDGYAYEYTYSRAYKYQKQFRAAQREAQSKESGLWAPGTCNGKK
ncbi:MAG: thermonuclease family protein [bacterium]